jgi:hypothetical protein
LAPHRFYVKEGAIQVKKIKENKKKGNVIIKSTTDSVKKVWELFTKKKTHPYWFLFNDLLVYCDAKPQAKSEDTKQFTFITSISLNDVKEVSPTKSGMEFVVLSVFWGVVNVNKKSPFLFSTFSHMKRVLLGGNVLGKETDFQLVLDTEIWKLSCQSVEEKKDWVDAIKKCLEQLHKSNTK